jgi:hypothetical protein
VFLAFSCWLRHLRRCCCRHITRVARIAVLRGAIGFAAPLDIVDAIFGVI